MSHTPGSTPPATTLPITSITIRPHNGPDTTLLAFATITLAGCFVIHDIRIIEPEGKDAFVAMPSRRRKDGKFNDICHPLNQATREEMETAILDAYDAWVDTLETTLQSTTRTKALHHIDKVEKALEVQHGR